MKQSVSVKIEGVITLDLDPERDNPEDSFDLLFEEIAGKEIELHTSKGMLIFDMEVSRLGLLSGRRVVLS